MKALHYSFAAIACVSTATTLLAISIGGFNPIDATVKIVTAPTRTVINAAQAAVGGGDPKKILDPARDVARAVAPVPALVVNTTTWPNEQLYKQARSLAAKTGSAGEFAFDVATVADHYMMDLTQAAGSAATNVLNGRNPFEFVAIPLAAAIREARDRHIGNAQPIPPDVRSALSHFYSNDVLNRAKYTVGTVEITLANIIGQGRRQFGDEVGVTVDDVIVFPVAPGSFNDNPAWWGHEMLHIQQFKELGVEEFALRYARSWGHELEDPAYARGTEVLEWARRQGTIAPAVIAAYAAARDERPTGPIIPAAYSQLAQNEMAAASSDPAVVKCDFLNDPNRFSYDFLGTLSGRIVVVERQTGRWMQIGWAVPPDMYGAQFGVAWIYFIPGRGQYDVFPNGQIMQRFTPPNPMDPWGRPGPPMQVGVAWRLN